MCPYFVVVVLPLVQFLKIYISQGNVRRVLGVVKFLLVVLSHFVH